MLSAQQLNESEFVAEGNYDDTYWWDGIAIRQYDSAAIALRAVRPPGGVWSNDTMSWTDTRVLADVQEYTWGAVKRSRAAAIEAPLPTPYGYFDTDPESRANIANAVLLAQVQVTLGLTVSIDWTLADNSTVTLTAAQMVEVGLLLGAQVQAAYATGRTLRTAIDAATTIPDAEAISWPTRPTS
jgi:hypothetical protein